MSQSLIIRYRNFPKLEGPCSVSENFVVTLLFEVLSQVTIMSNNFFKLYPVCRRQVEHQKLHLVGLPFSFELERSILVPVYSPQKVSGAIDAPPLSNVIHIAQVQDSEMCRLFGSEDELRINMGEELALLS